MNKTCEQWAALSPDHAALQASPTAIKHLISDAQRDIAELHKSNEALAQQCRELELEGNKFARTCAKEVDVLIAVEAERDALRAEVERLQEEHDKAWSRASTAEENAKALAVEVGRLRKDTERLEWLLPRINGRALREIGVIYSGGTDTMRTAIDTAIEASQ
ncbi:hypothetical protein [Azotobacter armeniacus]